MLLRIDVIADFICPWYHVGEARLRAALQMLAERAPEVRVEINRLPFFLDPTTPPEGYPYQPYLERKFGSAEAVARLQAQVAAAGAQSGAAFNFPAIALRPNTEPAHRLIQHVQGAGADAVAVSRLVQFIYSAYFEQGRDIGQPAELARLALGAGLGEMGLEAWLASDDGADGVAELVAQVQALGVEGVPFFVFDQRLAVSGAHPPEHLLDAMRQALAGDSAR
ncbi:MAG: DsbA family oxidoreductase [Rhodocyclaceae bacterium]|nr:DsbA family oxidoreductase [Rhodocyclaceae bacterium]